MGRADNREIGIRDDEDSVMRKIDALDIPAHAIIRHRILEPEAAVLRPECEQMGKQFCAFVGVQFTCECLQIHGAPLDSSETGSNRPHLNGNMLWSAHPTKIDKDPDICFSQTPSMRRRRRRDARGRCRPDRQQQERPGQKVEREHEIHAVDIVAGVPKNKTVDRWTYRRTKIAEAA